jgi:hypothetical protein
MSLIAKVSCKFLVLLRAVWTFQFAISGGRLLSMKPALEDMSEFSALLIRGSQCLLTYKHHSSPSRPACILAIHLFSNPSPYPFLPILPSFRPFLPVSHSLLHSPPLIRIPPKPSLRLPTIHASTGINTNTGSGGSWCAAAMAARVRKAVKMRVVSFIVEGERL